MLSEKVIEIKWTTGSEINNDYFEIEKSNNINDWQVIDKIWGAGWSSQLIDYKTYDTELIDGIYYYRLKQTDFDGQFSYSNISAVHVDKKYFLNNWINKNYIYIDILGRNIKNQNAIKKEIKK
jgi:hypothetical protein